MRCRRRQPAQHDGFAAYHGGRSGAQARRQAAAPSPVVAAAPAASALPSSPPLPPIMGFRDAVLFAANNMPQGGDDRRPDSGTVPLVVDPLIDRNSGVQSAWPRRRSRRSS